LKQLLHITKAHRSTVGSVGVRICIPLLALLLATISLSGCQAGTRAEQVTVAESAAGKTIRGVLVIGLSENHHRRRVFEEKLAQALSSRGVETIVGSDVAPTYSHLTKDHIKSILPKLEVDSVLVTKVTAVTSETVYSAMGTSTPPEKFTGGSWGHHYRNWAAEANDPTKVRFDVAQLETSLYDVGSEDRLLQVKSRSFNLRAIDKAISKLVSLIIDELDAQKFLGPH